MQGRRKGDWLERTAGQLAYGIFNRMLTHRIPANLVTARLMTARYVKALVSHQEREICLSGLWVITGFEQRPLTVQKGSRRPWCDLAGRALSVAFKGITFPGNALLSMGR